MLFIFQRRLLALKVALCLDHSQVSGRIRSVWHRAQTTIMNHREIHYFVPWNLCECSGSAPWKPQGLGTPLSCGVSILRGFHPRLHSPKWLRIYLHSHQWTGSGESEEEVIIFSLKGCGVMLHASFFISHWPELSLKITLSFKGGWEMSLFWMAIDLAQLGLIWRIDIGRYLAWCSHEDRFLGRDT